MSEQKDVIYETAEDGIATITVNRPKSLNALTYAIVNELTDFFTSVKNDDKVRAVIITGAGDKAFIVGADINELLDDVPLLERKNIMMRAHRLFGLMENLGKPVIAAVNGYALGGGCELAMACTLRITSDKARFGLPEITLGMIPGYGGTQRLPRLVGKGLALEMLLTGDPIDAEEAWRIGLVNKVVTPEQLMGKACKMAKTIISRGPMAVKYAIEVVNRGLDMNLDQALELEADYMVSVFATEDAKEGLKAFVEKRKPAFKGR